MKIVQPHDLGLNLMAVLPEVINFDCENDTNRL